MTEHDELHLAMCESRTFCPGGVGGWGYRPDCQKTALTTLFCFFFCVCLVLNLFYRRGPMVYFRETYNFSTFQRGSNYFQGLGVEGGGGGSNANFY